VAFPAPVLSPPPGLAAGTAVTMPGAATMQGAAAMPLGQTATQYSEVDPSWKPPEE